MSTAISYPFDLDDVGRLQSTENSSKIYLDRLLTLLSTSPGQRPMLPAYGTDVLKSLFENDNDVEAAISQAIQKAIAIWIPEISINEVIVGESDDNGFVPVNIIVQLPNSTLTTLSINSAIFNIDGTLTTE